MRTKKILIAHELANDFFIEGKIVAGCAVTKGLPQGAALCGASLTTRGLELLFSHPSFNEVDEGEESPYLVPVLECQD